eukprot:PhM_4_TR3253/c0_g1_i1/m.2896
MVVVQRDAVLTRAVPRDDVLQLLLLSGVPRGRGSTTGRGHQVVIILVVVVVVVALAHIEEHISNVDELVGHGALHDVAVPAALRGLRREDDHEAPHVHAEDVDRILHDAALFQTLLHRLGLLARPCRQARRQHAHLVIARGLRPPQLHQLRAQRLVLVVQLRVLVAQLRVSSLEVVQHFVLRRQHLLDSRRLVRAVVDEPLLVAQRRTEGLVHALVVLLLRPVVVLQRDDLLVQPRPVLLEQPPVPPVLRPRRLKPLHRVGVLEHNLVALHILASKLGGLLQQLRVQGVVARLQHLDVAVELRDGLAGVVRRHRRVGRAGAAAGHWGARRRRFATNGTGWLLLLLLLLLPPLGRG